MKFTETTPNEERGYFRRFISENGVWEVGFYRVIFGVRVRAGHVDNDSFCAIDLCAGADVQFQNDLLRVIIAILEKQPEDLTDGELCRIIPRYQTKPINLDPCWEKLKELAL